MVYKQIAFILAGTLLGLAGCGRPSSVKTTRLIDQFKQGMVKNSSATRNHPKPAEVWSFAEPGAESFGWTAGNGVTGVSVRNGHLQGHTTTSFPIVYIERKGKLDTPDLLNSIEVRLKVNKGTNLMITTQGAAPVDFKDVLERAKDLKQPWPFTSPILAGSDPQTIVLRNASTTRLAGIRRLLLRPTDVEGADFEIESVRLISE